MIRRDRTTLQIPTSLTTIECADNLTAIINDIRSGNAKRIEEGKGKISSTYYRGYHNSPVTGEEQDVAIALRDLYDKKCAFCERKHYSPQVEHFRPKKRVNGVTHSLGYYWLCYEWTNLIPVCDDCNKAKGNAFPLLAGGVRVTNPTFLANGEIDVTHNRYNHPTLSNERPKLLHPEYSNPQICFTFNQQGEIFGIDADGRGAETITTLKLHNRDLNFFRQKEIDHIVEISEYALLNVDDNVFISVLTKLRNRAMDKSQEYTLLLKIMYNEFVQFIVPLIDAAVRARASDLYQANRTIIDLTV